MEIPSSVKVTSRSIILIVASATIGFIITAHIINTNLIQYSSLPNTISLKVRDGSKSINDSVVFNLAVKSQFAIDSTDKHSAVQSNIIEKNILYHENPFFPVWGMLILVMITIASGSFPIFIGQIIILKKSFQLNGKEVMLGLFYAVLVTVFLILSNSSGQGFYNPPRIINDFHILFRNGNILPGIVIATIALMLPVMAVIFLIGPSSDKLLSQKVTKDNAEKIANGLEMLNQTLGNALQVLSVIIVFTVLSSGVLGKTIKATIEIVGYDIFPPEISYVYGIYFSLFLSVIYMPVYFYLKQQYSYFKTTLAGNGDISDANQKIMLQLDFKSSALDNLKTALTVLAPLITSFLPDNLHLFK